MTDQAPGTLRRLVHVPGPDLVRSAALGVLALVCLVVGRELAARNPGALDHGRLAAYALAVVLLVAGIGATRSAARELSRVIDLRADTTAQSVRASAPVRVAVLIVGYLFTVLMVLDVLQVDLSQFLLGGAVTGVVIGIAAQQTLGNFFAGTVLLISRPYTAGDEVTVYSGAINGPHRGTITDVGLIYTTLTTSTGDLKLPNSVLLASAVGPATPIDPDSQWSGPPPHA